MRLLKISLLAFAFLGATLAQSVFPPPSAICTLSGSATAGYVLTATGPSQCDWETVGGASVSADTVKNAWYIAGGGTANAITGTTTTTFPGAYAAGQAVIVKVSATNTGATTINVNSLGAKSVTKNGATALAAGNLVNGNAYLMVYDGTQFQVANFTILAADIPTLNQNTTGNAATATALAANGTNCSANNAAAGVDASGNAEGCFAPLVASSNLSDLANAATARTNLGGVAVGPASSTTNNCAKFADTSGKVLADAGAACGGGGGISGLTTTKIPKATSSTTIGDSAVTDDGTTVSSTEPIAAPSVAVGTSPPATSVCDKNGTTPAGLLCLGEGSTPIGTLLGVSVMWPDTSHFTHINNNNQDSYVVQTNSLPSAGIPHFAGSTPKVTSSAIVPGDMDVTADNTTANATTGHHGLVPKGTGNSTDCYLGTSAFGACPSGSSTTTDTREYYPVACTVGGSPSITGGWERGKTDGVNLTCAAGTLGDTYKTIDFYATGGGNPNKAVLHATVPAGWTSGEVDLLIYVTPGAATTDTFSIQTGCTGSGGDFDNPSLNTAQTLNTSGTNTSEVLTLSNLTMTGCAATNDLVITFTRTDANAHYDGVLKVALKTVRAL